jgi:hypothetical protein
MSLCAHGSTNTIVRSALSLCLLLLAFPSRNRFKDRLMTAAVDVVASWTSISIVGPRTHALVHGHRGETDTVGKMQARVEYDLQSLRNGCLGLDLRTIARTFTVILRGRRVY